MKSIKILLVDNRELIYRGVRSMLEKEEDMEIVGICSSLEEALLQMQRLRPDIVLMGIQLPIINWIEAISNLKKGRPGSGVDVILLAESIVNRTDALKAGAANYLLEDTIHKELIRAIRNAYGNSHLLKEHDNPIGVEEVIEVVIPPSSSSAQLLKFMCQLAEQHHGNFASIVCATGSWDRGATITVRSQLNRSSNLVIQLANMPGVHKVEEQLPAEGALSGFANRFEFLSRLGINPSRRLYITLDETSRVEAR